MIDYIRKSVNAMTGYVPGEQPSDENIVKLNTNENPYPPSPFVMDAVADISERQFRVYPDPVSCQLRSRIAELNGCGEENVFVGNGSDEVLALCTRAFIENDGSLGYLDPSYSLYSVLADIRDVEVRPLPLNADFTWSVPEDYKASLFMLTNPNAPTGMMASLDLAREFCVQFDGIVLVDEAYVDFASESCMELAKELDNVIVSRSLSKSYSLAGVRAGYAVGSAELIGALYKLKDSYNVNVLTQKLALAALSDVDHMKANVQRILATRERLTAVLEDMGYSVCPSSANFLWVKPFGCTAKEMFERLKNKGILIRYFEGNRTGEYIRITVGTDEEIDKLIEAIR